jgi:hypothetical protein
MYKSPLAVLFAIVALLSGCATAQLHSDIATGTDLQTLKKIYVVRLPKDERGVEKLIAEHLNALGKEATSGEKADAPASVDAIVTYQDKWMWDITMYMIELNVQVRNPKTEISLANGHSLRTSLVRKSPREMVTEVLNDLFKQTK